METEVDVPNPNLVLIPGMYAEVSLLLEHRPRVVAAPIPAIDLGADESTGQVTVVTPQNRVEIRKVQLELQTAQSIEVRQGLREGELLVTGNRSSLRPGQQVRPKLVETTVPATR
jgi:hypothetical protein